MRDLAFFLSTSDGYSDCWNPFFTLLKKYWPDFDGTIYMTTEFLDYHFDGLNIVPLMVSKKHNVNPKKQPTWGKRMKWALKMIPEDNILFMQEDFFLKDFVNQEKFDECVRFFFSHNEVKCLHLTDRGPSELEPSQFANFDCVSIDQEYRISCQIALWRKSELLGLIKQRESAWDLEFLGSQRSSAMSNLYLAVRKEDVKYGVTEIIPYLVTGIIKGKWKQEVVPLFENNDIYIDLSKRGIWNGVFEKKDETLPMKFKRRYKDIMNQLEIKYIKLTHQYLSML